MERRFFIVRILLGLIGTGGLGLLILGLMDGEFHWRGHTTTLDAQPGGFWFLAVVNGLTFAGLILFSVCARADSDKEPRL